MCRQILINCDLFLSTIKLHWCLKRTMKYKISVYIELIPHMRSICCKQLLDKQTCSWIQSATNTQNLSNTCYNNSYDLFKILKIYIFLTIYIFSGSQWLPVKCHRQATEEGWPDGLLHTDRSRGECRGYARDGTDGKSHRPLSGRETLIGSISQQFLCC